MSDQGSIVSRLATPSTIVTFVERSPCGTARMEKTVDAGKSPIVIYDPSRMEMIVKGPQIDMRYGNIVSVSCVRGE